MGGSDASRFVQLGKPLRQVGFGAVALALGVDAGDQCDETAREIAMKTRLGREPKDQRQRGGEGDEDRRYLDGPGSTEVRQCRRSAHDRDGFGQLVQSVVVALALAVV